MVRGGSLNTSTCWSSSSRHWGLARLRRARWYTFTLHVKWSSNPSVGFVEVWLNGRKVVPKRQTRRCTTASSPT
ncbi:MAG: heparin lyase I family protein [Actinobacteria bacterium]|nr:heparin lyase I family protein [Actinomycetota bacterium]